MSILVALAIVSTLTAVALAGRAVLARHIVVDDVGVVVLERGTMDALMADELRLVMVRVPPPSTMWFQTMPEPRGLQ